MSSSDSEKNNYREGRVLLLAQRVPESRGARALHEQAPIDQQQVLELTKRSEPQARGFLARSSAFKMKALPLQVLVQRGQKILSVAVADKECADVRQQLTFLTGFSVELVAVEKEILERALISSYAGDDQVLEESVSALSDYAQNIRTDSSYEHSDTNEVTRFVTRIIEYAIAHQASDIHLSVRRNGSFIQVRVGDELRVHPEPIGGIEAHRQVVSRIKILAGLDTTERMKPQDGRLSFPLHERFIDVRVSTLPTVHGESVVLRLFGLNAIRPFSSLGLVLDVQREIERCMRSCSGALVVSGPTGSGKTSTLYAIAHELMRRGKRVSTIEDPVEITLEGAVQTSINEGVDFGFAQALRSVLRQDPDVILVGEMRESRSAAAAFDAALSGHLVLSTVHGSSVVDTLNRFSYLGIGRILVAQGLGILLSQRLINRLCPDCRVFDLRAANTLGFDVHQPVGCARCNHTGYSGKILAVEALSFNDSIREFVCRADIVTSSLLQEHAGRSFWQFKDQLYEHLAKGEIGYAQFSELV